MQNGRLSISDILQKFASYIVQSAVGNSEVHFLIAPAGAADIVLLENLIDGLVPQNRVFGSSAVDNAVFAAVKRDVKLRGFVYGLLEKCRKVIGGWFQISVLEAFKA